MDYSLTPSSQYYIVICPSNPGSSTNPCNTVIAYVKIYNTFLTFDNICQYRLASDISENLKASWALNYYDTTLTSDIIKDESTSQMQTHFTVNS